MTNTIKEKEGTLALDKYQACDFVSMDQVIVSTPGWLLIDYGWEGHYNCFHGGTIFNDEATDAIWVGNQSPLGAGETIMANTCTMWFLVR